MGQNSGYKNCGGCEFSFKVAQQQYVCRRYPPIGQIAQSHGPVIGAAPRQAYVSFFPPIQVPMTCGEWQNANNVTMSSGHTKKAIAFDDEVVLGNENVIK